MKQNFYFLTMLLLVISATSNGQVTKTKQRKIRTTKRSVAYIGSTAQLKFAQANLERIESQMGYSWVDDEWVESDKMDFVYNDDNYLEVATYLEKEEETWNTSFKDVFSYNGDGRISSYTEYDWSEGSWEKALKYDYEYNTEGYVSVEIYWGGNGDFEPSDKTEYFYYSNGKINYKIDYTIESEVWVRSNKMEYIYDDDNILIQTNSFSWSGTQWESSLKEIYNLDENGHPNQSITYTISDSEWEISGKATYTFDDNGNPLSDSFQDIESEETVVNVEHYEYTYDVSGLFKDIVYVYDDMFMTYFYDMIYNKPLLTISKRWNSTDEMWENNWKGEFIYLGTTTNVVEQNFQTKVYPTEVIKDVTVEVLDRAAFKVYNLSGSCVLETKIEG